MEHQYHLRQGAEVFGVDGGKVGKLKTYGAQFLVVEKGFFFPTDYFIPFSAVDNYTEEEVFLKVTKDEALNQGWDVEPVDTSETAPIAGSQHHGYDSGAFRQNAFELDPAARTEGPGEMASRPEKLGGTGQSKEPLSR